MALVHPPSNPDPAGKSPSRRPNLNRDQLAKLSTLLDHLNTPDFTLPLTVKEARSAQKWRIKHLKEISTWTGQSLNEGGSIKNTTPLSDREKAWLTSEQIQRFLRATKWDLSAAYSRTEETIVWRREFEVDLLNDDPTIVEEESKTGKEIVMGWDVQNRPCLYMFPGRQNTKQSPKQIQFVVWTLERAADMMPPGVENLCLLIDFGAGEKGGGQPTSLGQAKKVLDILQTYYCERLGRAICINVPTLFWGFYKLVGPFVDPVTKDKIRFNPDVRTLVPPSQLEKANFKGDYDFEYNHDQYYPFISEMTKTRRDDQFRRWQQHGNGKCGASEFILRGGMEAAQANEADTSSSERTQIPSQETGGSTIGGGGGKEAAMGAGAVGVGGGIASQSTNATHSMNSPSTANEVPSHVSSPTPSTESSGYRLPAEAENAPDYIEEDDEASPSQSPLMPMNSSLAMPDTPVHAPAVTMNGMEGNSGSQNGRPRNDSSASFVTTREAPSSATDNTYTAKNDMIAELPVHQANGGITSKSMPTPSMQTQTSPMQILNTGVHGLVINPDGSIGAAH